MEAGWDFEGCLFLEALGALGDGSRGRREEGSAVALEVAGGRGWLALTCKARASHGWSKAGPALP